MRMIFNSAVSHDTFAVSRFSDNGVVKTPWSVLRARRLAWIITSLV